jgi:nitrogen regulatory protein PII
MKLINAIIRPESLEVVQAALHEREAWLMSVSQVLSDGGEPGREGIYRGVKFRVRRRKLRVEIAADDWGVEGAVDAVLRAGSTSVSGQIGDCKVFVMHLDEYVASVMARKD